MQTEKLQQQGRLAFRVEGDNWVAYWALPDTMKDAIYLASIRIGAVTHDQNIKAAFMELMRETVASLFRQSGIVVEGWSDVRSAQDSERSGNA